MGQKQPNHVGKLWGVAICLFLLPLSTIQSIVVTSTPKGLRLHTAINPQSTNQLSMCMSMNLVS